jgi:hypothetical protein
MAERGEVCIHLELGGAEPIRIRAEWLRQASERCGKGLVLEEPLSLLGGSLSPLYGLVDLGVLTHLLEGLLDNFFLDESAAELEILSARENCDLIDLLLRN